MPFSYQPSKSLWLRQGEIIEDLFELRPIIPVEQVPEAEEVAKLQHIDHKYTIIVSQDCDLEWDYKARYTKEVSEDKLLAHVLFCDLFSQEEVRLRSNLKSDQFKRVKQNQDERYHRLDGAPINETDQTLPELYADFKVVFSLPVEFVYALIPGGQVARSGRLPSPYLEDFMHRLYSFLGRVAVPEFQENKNLTVVPRDSSHSEGLTST